MFREFPVHERFLHAKELGFLAVEIQNPMEVPLAEFATGQRNADISVALLNVGLADYPTGGLGLSGVPGREDQFKIAFETALINAETLGAMYLHLGPSRIPNEESRSLCLETYRRNLDLAVKLHRASGSAAELLIEPMNRVDAPLALINDFGVAAKLIRQEYSGAIGLQFDAYHVAMNELNPVRAFQDMADITRHVQFSDAPGRHQPGTGKIDFPWFFEFFAGSDYDGYLGAEYLPLGPTLDSFGWLEQARMRA
jgi:hydroxypyruvate isomerase